MLVDILDIYARGVFRNDLGIEFNGIGDLDRIGAVRPQKQLGVIELVKIVDRAGCAELDAFDLLQVDEEDLLFMGGRSRIFDAGKCIANGGAELAVEQRGRSGVLNSVIPFLGRVVDDFAAVHQNHELVWVHVDDGTIRDHVGISAAVVVSAVGANGNALGENGTAIHIIGFQDL